MINARDESLTEKESFKMPFEKQRCLVIADGFYEWKKEGAAKKPFYIRLKSKQPFGFAGLYNIWKSPEGTEVVTSTKQIKDRKIKSSPIESSSQKPAKPCTPNITHLFSGLLQLPVVMF
jgi:hypothetical protein